VLEIRMLGSAAICLAGADPPLTMPPAAATLFGYLLVHHAEPQSRELLSSVFWGDLPSDTSRRRLNTTVWRVRRVLEPTPSQRDRYLVVTPKTIGVRVGSFARLDVAEFESAVLPVLRRPQSQMTSADASRLREAVDLYRGDLLVGSYDNWVIRERERLAGLALSTLARLVVWHRDRAEYEEAIGYAERVLAHDPLREDVYRTLMRLYADAGQRARALQTFARCRDLLDEELGVAPLPETIALVDSIGSNRPHAAPIDCSTVLDPAHRPPLLGQLINAQRQVRDLELSIAQAIDQLSAH